jgi:hypothetical protein
MRKEQFKDCISQVHLPSDRLTTAMAKRWTINVVQ